MEKVNIGIGYRCNGGQQDILPFGAESLSECEPVYEEVEGWSESTVGVTRLDRLPKAAQDYLRRIEAVCGVPVDIISTGADRDQTIVRRHPFEKQ